MTARLFDGGGDVTWVAVINRGVGGSFIVCGLIAWQRRPDNRTGQLMTMTGFLFQAEALFPWKTARDNVAIGLEVAGVAGARRTRVPTPG